MTNLLAHATAALAEHVKSTAGYVFDVADLQPDLALLAHAKKSLLSQPLGDEDDAKYFKLLCKGEGRYTAARKLGLNPVSIKRRIQADEDFAERVSVAEAEALEVVVSEMRKQAELGDIKAATWLLERKSSNEFSTPERKSHDININLNLNALAGAETDPVTQKIMQLEAELKEAAQARQLGPGVIDIPESDIEEL